MAEPQLFTSSLPESMPMASKGSRWPVFFSVALQVLIVALLVLVPLLHPEVVKNLTPRLAILEPPVIHHDPPPPPAHVVARPSSTNVAPMPIARPAITSDRPPVDIPAVLPIVSGDHANPLERIIASTPSGSPTVEATTAPPTPPAPPRPVRISTASAAVLLDPIRPVYPEIAKRTGTQGTVVVNALISKRGAIESATVISGPALLRAAALDAVRTARYKPYLLSGESVEVETNFTVIFKLSGQ